jgi:hypothetical protein
MDGLEWLSRGARVGSDLAMTVLGVRRAKAALSSGCKSHPATAPAGSHRSSHGGNEVASDLQQMWRRGVGRAITGALVAKTVPQQRIRNLVVPGFRKSEKQSRDIPIAMRLVEFFQSGSFSGSIEGPVEMAVRYNFNRGDLACNRVGQGHGRLANCAM